MAKAIGARQLGGADIGARQAAAVSATALLASDVESASEVSSPSLGIVRALLGNDVQSLSEVSVPALGIAPDAPVDDVQPGGFLPKPVIYLDRNGNPIDLDAVQEEVAEAVKAAPKLRKASKKRREQARASAARTFAAISQRTAAAEADVRRLKALLAGMEAQEALMRIVEAQARSQAEDEEALLAFMMVM